MPPKAFHIYGMDILELAAFPASSADPKFPPTNDFGNPEHQNRPGLLHAVVEYGQCFPPHYMTAIGLQCPYRTASSRYSLLGHTAGHRYFPMRTRTHTDRYRLDPTLATEAGPATG